MQSALAGLGGQGPEGLGQRDQQDAMTLVFTSCDPGKHAAKVASGKSMDAVALALGRTYLSLQLVKTGMDVADRPLWRGPAGPRASPSPSSTTRQFDPNRVAQAIGRAAAAKNL